MSVLVTVVATVVVVAVGDEDFKTSDVVHDTDDDKIGDGDAVDDDDGSNTTAVVDDAVATAVVVFTADTEGIQHAVPDPSPKNPFPQVRQKVEMPSTKYVPTPQHTVTPALVHLAVILTPHELLSQFRQVDAPGVPAYPPGAHRVHVVDEELAAYVPATHFWHAAAPAVDAYDPGAHGTNCVSHATTTTPSAPLPPD